MICSCRSLPLFPIIFGPTAGDLLTNACFACTYISPFKRREGAHSFVWSVSTSAYLRSVTCIKIRCVKTTQCVPSQFLMPMLPDPIYPHIPYIYMALKQVHNAREESQPNASSPKSEEDKAGPHRVPANQMPVLVVMPDPTPEKIDDMGLWNFWYVRYIIIFLLVCHGQTSQNS